MPEDELIPIELVAKGPCILLLLKLKEVLVGDLIAILIKEEMIPLRDLNVQRLYFWLTQRKSGTIVPLKELTGVLRKNRLVCHLDWCFPVKSSISILLNLNRLV